MRLKSGPEKQPEDAIRDIRPATRPRAEFGLIQRQAHRPTIRPRIASGTWFQAGSGRQGRSAQGRIESCRCSHVGSPKPTVIPSPICASMPWMKSGARNRAQVWPSATSATITAPPELAMIARLRGGSSREIGGIAM
jgi:hypothetical protein